MLSKFSGSSLSRSQLKAIKGGGIDCTMTATWPDGTQYSSTGGCGLSSIAECNSGMQQNCSVMQGSGGTCTYACYDSPQTPQG